VDKKIKHIIICAIVLMATAGIAFYAGILYSKNSKISDFNDQRFGSGNIPENTSFNRQANPNSNLGEIIAKDEKTITIKLSSGGSKIILLSESTQINKISQGYAEDLKIGENVMVQGTTNSDGSVTAKTIQITPDAEDMNMQKTGQ
jgi:hypothetical protein